MRKERRRFATVVANAALILVLMHGCKWSSSTGSLQLRVVDEVEAKTLLPAISMQIETYDIRGTGPNGESFEQPDFAGSSVTFDRLAFGDWSVVVEGKNAAGTPIGRGEASTTVHTGQTSVVDITVTPLGGRGYLDLTVNWNETDTDIPSIDARLISPDGTVAILPFAISGGDTGSSVGNEVLAGYHTLSIRLLDNGLLTMGAVEVVRIVKDETTGGVFGFTEINKPGGSIEVKIKPQMGEPLEVEMSGQRDEMTTTETMEVTASVPPEVGAVTYVWYLNGESRDVGESYEVSGLAEGVYRLDVTAFTADGTRAGSVSHHFRALAEVFSVGPAGGTVTAQGGDLTLVFPEGALDTTTEIGISGLDRAKVNTLLAGGLTNMSVLGGFSGHPDGLEFVVPINVEMSVSPRKSLLGLPLQAYIDTAGGLYLAPTDLLFDPSSGKVQIQIEHFSTNIVVEAADGLPPDHPCRSGLIHVESKMINFSSKPLNSGDCQIISDEVKVTFLSCEGQPVESVRVVERTSGCGGDTTPPWITNVTPADGATEVDVTTGVDVTFNEPMITLFVQSAFTLKDENGPVNGQFTWGGGDSMMRFVPDSVLSENMKHYAEISRDARDKSGNPLALSGLNNIQFTTSEYFQLTVTAKGAGTVQIDPPPAPYGYKHGTTVRLRAEPDPCTNMSHWEDATGKAVGTDPELLIRMLGDESITAVFVGSRPAIVSTYPADGATDVPPTTRIVVDFSEPMQKAATNSAFTVRSVHGDAVGGHIGWNSASDSLLFTPDLLFGGTTYIVNVTTAALEQSGCPLARDFSSVFTTRTEGGYLVVWGDTDGIGAPNVPTGNDFVEVDTDNAYCLALRSNGSIEAWGSNTYGQTDAPQGHNFVKIAAGSWHGLAVTSGGVIEAWGHNDHGQTNVPSGYTYKEVAAGTFHSLALTANGTIVGWGGGTADNVGQATPPQGNGYVGIAAGRYHSLAIGADGSIEGWGSNISNQISIPERYDYVSVAAGAWHGLALTSGGYVVAWGSNTYGQTDAPTTNGFVAIAAGENFSLALRSDGSIVGWGYQYDGQTVAPTQHRYTSLAAGDGNGLAIAQ